MTEQFSLTSHTGMNIIVQMNIIVRVLLRVMLPIFLGYVPRGGIAWSSLVEEYMPYNDRCLVAY